MPKKAKKPEFAVIGLGRFGTSLALTLVENGYVVLGIDRNRELVQSLADEITMTVALDATDEDALREVDISAYDTVVVAIGDDFESSILTTVTLKDLGVRQIVCKAQDERQSSVLLKVGADRVVLPESEAGERLAYLLTVPLTLGQLAVGSDHSIMELERAGVTGRAHAARSGFVRALRCHCVGRQTRRCADGVPAARYDDRQR